MITFICWMMSSMKQWWIVQSCVYFDLTMQMRVLSSYSMLSKLDFSITVFDLV